MVGRETALIVGLGNPGKDYEGTRHNIGFSVAEALAGKYSLGFRKKAKFKGLVAEGSLENSSVCVLKPLTFMNLSGESVASLSQYLKILPSRILVIVDDVDLPFGQIRLKINSGPGTHNGLRSVEDHLKTNRYARLRIGVGDKIRGSLADFVLSRFSAEEERELPKITEKAMQAIEIWLDRGITRAMDFANCKNPPQ